MFGGTPCQDFSIAGKQGGATWVCDYCGHTYNPLEAHYSSRDKCPECGKSTIEKTRSSLLVEWLRFLREKKPNFAIYENVKNIIGSRFKSTFDLFIKELDEYGYNTYWKVLNAKHYGIPQNRERVFCIIIRKDLDNGLFQFPKPIPLKNLLNDLLEDEVDKKYYLDESKVANLLTPPCKSVEQSEVVVEVQQIDTLGISLLQGKRGVMLNKHGKQLNGVTDVAVALLARDYKGISNNQNSNGVIEIINENSSNERKT